ncbi:hypothetical protein SeLEV6574_g00157 [Synchytrium endobioticum]|uniref:BRO domain-containing protein 1 n=1 Tax=Synchytrium endobioticum TaxID=286115 RepID=A0A507DLC0_9FUNG|nr:hypothetical protein SeLEV6574_g00157 [Synchytrium endobioticum]
MLSNAPPSFQYLYDAALPFYDGPNLSSNTERSAFLSLPTKRNSSHHLNAAPTTANHLVYGVKSLVETGARAASRLAKNDLHVDRSATTTTTTEAILIQRNKRNQSHQFLDFKAVLLPTLLALVQPEQAVSMKSAFTLPQPTTHRLQHKYPLEKEESRLQLLKTTELLLPIESQWHALNQMRIHAGAPEKSLAGIEKLAQYYAQLVYLEQKFPFETGKLDVTFTWFEAFADEKKILTNCIQYEKASVLYNMGAIFSEVAVGQQVWTSDGKKHASAYFQKAAGVFIFIRDALCNRYRIRLDKSSDVSEQTLTASAQLMLAQALECFYEKAIQDHVSSPITAQIAAQCADYYQIAQRSANANNGFAKIRYPREWVARMKAKHLLLTAIAHFHTPSTLPADMVVAERVTRLTVARGYAFQASKAAQITSSAMKDVVEAYTEVIVNALLATDAANFEKHHQSSIDVRLLTPLKRPSEALVAPPTASQVIGPLNRFHDLFHAVIAPNHHQDIRQFLQDCGRIVEAGRVELVNSVIEIDAKLAALGLSLADASKEVDPDTKSDGGNFTTRVNASMLIEQIKVYQKEESLISSEDLIKNLRRFHEIICGNIQESMQILEKINQALNTRDVNLVSQVSTLRQSALEMNESLNERKAKFGDLYLLYETEIAEFSPLSWSEDKLKVILPCLEGASMHEIRTRLAATKNEQVLFLNRLGATRAECMTKLEEVHRFGTGLDDFTTGEDLDVLEALSGRRRQLKILEDAIRQTRKDKDELLVKVQSLTQAVAKDEAAILDEEQSQTIIDSFKSTFSHYAVFREEIQNEIKKCLRFRDESANILARCHELNGDNGTKGDCGALSLPQRVPGTLPPDSPRLDRDPLVASLVSSNNLSARPQSPDHNASDGPSSPTRVRTAIPGVKVTPSTTQPASATHNPEMIVINTKETEETRRLLEEELPQPTLQDFHTLDSIPAHPSDPQLLQTEGCLKRLIVIQQAEISRLAALHKAHESHIRELQKRQSSSNWAKLEELGKGATQSIKPEEEPAIRTVRQPTLFERARTEHGKRAPLLEIKRKPLGAPIKYVNDFSHRPLRVETAKIGDQGEKPKSALLSKFLASSGPNLNNLDGSRQLRYPSQRSRQSNIVLEPTSRKTSYATAIEVLSNGQRVPVGLGHRMPGLDAFGGNGQYYQDYDKIDQDSDLHPSEIDFFEGTERPGNERYETLLCQNDRLKTEDATMRQSSANNARKLRKVKVKTDHEQQPSGPVRYPSVTGLSESEGPRPQLNSSSGRHDAKPSQLQAWVSEQRRTVNVRSDVPTWNADITNEDRTPFPLNTKATAFASPCHSPIGHTSHSMRSVNTGQTIMMMSHDADALPDPIFQQKKHKFSLVKRVPVNTAAIAAEITSSSPNAINAASWGSSRKNASKTGKHPFEKYDSGIGASGGSLSAATTDESARQPAPSPSKVSSGKRMDVYSKMKHANDQVVEQFAQLANSSSEA